MRATAVLLLVSAALAAGCGGEDDDETARPTEPLIPPPTEPVEPPPAIDMIDGEYEATIPASARRRYPKVLHRPGRWRLLIAQGALYFEGPGRPGDEEIRFKSIDETTLVVHADARCVDRRARLTDGRYRYALHGGALRFRAVSEPCGDHRVLMPTAPWRRR